MSGNSIETARMMAYDTSYAYSCTLYDNMPYHRDYDKCNEKTICMYSGNIIKNNYYNVSEPVKIDNGDSETRVLLDNLRAEASVVAEDELREIDTEVTDEDAILQGLMSDYVEDGEELASVSSGE